MNPQDLITQVRNPDEGDDQSGESESDEPVQNTGNSGSGGCFWCCGSGHDNQNTNSKSKTQLSIPNNATGGDQGMNSPKYPSRDTVNSPRDVNPGEQIPWREDHLLPPQRENKKGKKCLVLDLDETLVHSSFKPVDQCDFVIPVEIENHVHKVYVCKRPHVDEFMKRCGEIYEVVIFTASLAKYADPVLDLLDIHKVVDWRLFRESCSPFKGTYVKDMGRMGRDLSQIMIIDNSPHSFAFNPENAIPCDSWFSDMQDKELLEFIPVLEELSKDSVADVRDKLKELKISGLEALKKELGTGDSEYTDDEDSEFDTESE